MMYHKDVISVIVPMYNAEATLQRCVNRYPPNKAAEKRAGQRDQRVSLAWKNMNKLNLERISERKQTSPVSGRSGHKNAGTPVPW